MLLANTNELSRNITLGDRVKLDVEIYFRGKQLDGWKMALHKQAKYEPPCYCLDCTKSRLDVVDVDRVARACTGVVTERGYMKIGRR